MNEHIIWEEYLLGLGVEAKVKQLQSEGCPEDTARAMVEQDAKDYREAMRKQHSPMTQAQGERIVELLEKLTSPQDTQLDIAMTADKREGATVTFTSTDRDPYRKDG